MTCTNDSTTRTPMLEAALEYVSQGFRVFPVRLDKTPYTVHGLKDATATVLGVREFWGKWPDAGVGLVTDGLVVLDFDAKSGGLENKPAMEAKFGPLPKTRTHRTGGGGLHLLYRNPNGTNIRNAVELGGYPGVDLRANGGYIVAPPSGHASGGRYAVLDPAEIAAAPAWLLELAAKRTSQATTIPKVEGIPERKRNATLTSLAGTMRRRGMSQESIAAALIHENERCQPPLPESEVASIAASVARYAPDAQGEDAAATATRFPRTDSGNAELIAQMYGSRLRYDHRRGRWLLWATHYWKPDSDGEIHRLALEAARERYRRAASIEDLADKTKESAFAIQSENKGRLEAAVSLAQNLRPIADTGEHWDDNPWLLGCPNGVVDLRTGQLRDGKPTDRITMSTGISFDPNAKCPRFERFIAEVFPDPKLRDWIDKALGYSATADVTEQCFFDPYGSGGNGKTVLVEVVSFVLGDYAHVAPFSMFEAQYDNPIPNDLAALDHKRFVTASETKPNSRFNEARLKELAGSGRISARFLYQEPFTFQPVAKIWLSTNHRPHVEDETDGFWRKVRLIPFVVKFTDGNADRSLTNKLKAEAEGILAWLVRGAMRWRTEGLEPLPECVILATATYRQDEDPLSDFIGAKCVTDPKAAIGATTLYKAYKVWAESEGMTGKDVLTATTFGTRMGTRFAKRHDRGGAVYDGIALAEGWTPPLTPGCVTGVTGCEPISVNPREGTFTRGVSVNAPPTRHTDTPNPSQAGPGAGGGEDAADPGEPGAEPCFLCGQPRYAYQDDGRPVCERHFEPTCDRCKTEVVGVPHWSKGTPGVVPPLAYCPKCAGVLGGSWQ